MDPLARLTTTQKITSSSICPLYLSLFRTAGCDKVRRFWATSHSVLTLQATIRSVSHKWGVSASTHLSVLMYLFTHFLSLYHVRRSGLEWSRAKLISWDYKGYHVTLILRSSQSALPQRTLNTRIYYRTLYGHLPPPPFKPNFWQSSKDVRCSEVWGEVWGPDTQVACAVFSRHPVSVVKVTLPA